MMNTCRIAGINIILFLTFACSAISQVQTVGEFRCLGVGINSDKSDFSNYISGFGGFLFFSSNRISGKTQADGTPTYDIYAAVLKNNEYAILNENWVFSDNFEINTGFNEGSACISADGKFMYYSVCREKSKGSCDIYEARIELDGNRINVISSYPLPDYINTKYYDSQPSISPDGLNLFFVSDRPIRNDNSYDLNIFVSQFDTISNIWGEPLLLDGINTDANEFNPVMTNDNLTLIFASSGHVPNYGDNDIFISRFHGDIWEEPVNAGELINTGSSEFALVITADGKKAYLSSSRSDINCHAGDIDIYFSHIEPFIENALTISWFQENSEDVIVEIFDNEGSPVRTYELNNSAPGRHAFNWDGFNKENKPVIPGYYYYDVIIGSSIPEKTRLLYIK